MRVALAPQRHMVGFSHLSLTAMTNVCGVDPPDVDGTHFHVGDDANFGPEVTAMPPDSFLRLRNAAICGGGHLESADRPSNIAASGAGGDHAAPSSPGSSYDRSRPDAFTGADN